MEVWKLRAKYTKKYVTFSEVALKSAIAKIPWEFPEILLFSQIPWGAWEIPWDFPDFSWKGHFPEFSRVHGNPDLCVNHLWQVSREVPNIFIHKMRLKIQQQIISSCLKGQWVTPVETYVYVSHMDNWIYKVFYLDNLMASAVLVLHLRSIVINICTVLIRYHVCITQNEMKFQSLECAYLINFPINSAIIFVSFLFYCVLRFNVAKSIWTAALVWTWPTEPRVNSL